MAERRTSVEPQERAFDMRALLRLGIWGAAATVALVLTVLSAFSTTGSQRLAMSRSNGAPLSGPPAAQLAGRAAEIESETRRLSEAVQALAADRDRLLTRIASLESGLEDITGSIKRQSAGITPENPPEAPATATPSVAALPTIPVPEMPAPAAPPNPGPNIAPGASAPPPATRVANAPTAGPVDDVVADMDPDKPTPEFGIDVGGATTFEGLRTLWNTTKRNNRVLFNGLRPLVAVRESKPRGVNLRLVVGPFANDETVARVCAVLATARHYCRPAPFQGQQFTLATPAPAEPERRPGTLSKPAAAAPQPRPPVRTIR